MPTYVKKNIIMCFFFILIHRTMQSFDAVISKLSKTAEFTIPAEVCVMINTLSDCKAQVSSSSHILTTLCVY